MACSNCGGSGKERCARCSGAGKVVNVLTVPRVSSASWTAICPVCQGSEVITCRACRGTGQSVPAVAGQRCARCGGARRVRCESYLCRGSGHYVSPTGMIMVCSMCMGTGRMNCPDCGRRG